MPAFQNECGAAAAAVPGGPGEGPGAGSGGCARPAEPAVWTAPEAAVERGLGAGPAVPGPRHQGRAAELGRSAAAHPAAPQVRDVTSCMLHQVD